MRLEPKEHGQRISVLPRQPLAGGSGQRVVSAECDQCKATGFLAR